MVYSLIEIENKKNEKEILMIMYKNKIGIQKTKIAYSHFIK